MSLGATLPGATSLGAVRPAMRPVWLRPLALGVILALHAALFLTFRGEPAMLAPLDAVEVTLAPLGDSAIDQQRVEEIQPPPPATPPAPAPEVEPPPELAAPPPNVVAPEAAPEAPKPEAPKPVAKPKPKPVEAARLEEARQEKIKERLRQDKIREKQAEQKDAAARREKEQEARQQARRGVAEGSRSGGMSSASYAALLAGELRRHTFYPAAARAVGATGTVGVAFTVGPSGRVVSQSITRSSGNGALDAAAHAIMSAVRTPPPPGGSYSTTTNLRFNFH